MRAVVLGLAVMSREIPSGKLARALRCLGSRNKAGVYLPDFTRLLRFGYGRA
jgi:hypothetical protein